MARRTFFSFHYKPDVGRAWIVRNSWMTKPDHEDVGFFDSSVFESKKRVGDDELKRFLRDGLHNTSVTCVLAGTDTAVRRWVRYEIFQSFIRGNGLLVARINGIADFTSAQTAMPGPDPFASIAFAVEGDHVRFKEYMTSGWEYARDVGSMALTDVRYDLRGMKNNTFGCLFPIYDYVQEDGYKNLSSWIDTAASHAGRD